MDKAPLDSEESPIDPEGIDDDVLLSTEGHVSHNSLLHHIPEVDRFSSDDENETDKECYDDDEEEYSIYENNLEELSDEALSQGEPNICSLEEAIDLRKKLRQLGPANFLESTVGAGKIGVEKLLSAFGIRPPILKNRLPDSAYYGLLSLAISRELANRIKLPQYNTVDDAVSLIKNAKNIIVLTGAGISTSLGIPDFRSKDVGLYSKLNHLGLNDPQEVFDINIFKEDPSIFYSIAGDILPETHRFSPTHAFIYLLQQKGKLLTNYSQNIDNIEKVAGILPEKLIQCHGSFATASCVECKYQVPGDTIFDDIRAFRIPRCKNCIKNISTIETTNFMKRKRSSNMKEKKRKNNMCHSNEISSDEDIIQEAGVMKPDITFFGEPLPDGFSDRLTNHDKDLVDLVIVIGTSLKVAPVSEIVSFLPAEIPQIYISRTRVSHVNFDVDLLGDCDVVVAELCRRAGWDLNHEMVPKDQKIQIKLQEGFIHRHVFTVQN